MQIYGLSIELHLMQIYGLFYFLSDIPCWSYPKGTTLIKRSKQFNYSQKISDFCISKSLQPDVQTTNFPRLNSINSKYQRFPPLDCKDSGISFSGFSILFVIVNLGLLCISKLLKKCFCLLVKFYLLLSIIIKTVEQDFLEIKQNKERK